MYSKILIKQESEFDQKSRSAMFMVFIDQPYFILPMSGAVSRFYKNGYMMSKVLIKINGKPPLYSSTMPIKKVVDISDLAFIVLQHHVEEHSIDSVIGKYYPHAKIVTLSKILSDLIFTFLGNVEDISDNAPIAFNDCTHMFQCNDVNKLMNSVELESDGILFGFSGNELTKNGPCHNGF